jgi:hypothetical protein
MEFWQKQQKQNQGFSVTIDTGGGTMTMGNTADDSFIIPDTGAFELSHELREVKESYPKGDFVEGTISVTSHLEQDFHGTLEVEFSVFGNTNQDALLHGLKAGETKSISYSYTITDDDSRRGEVTADIFLKVDGKPYGTKDSDRISFTVKATE